MSTQSSRFEALRPVELRPDALVSNGDVRLASGGTITYSGVVGQITDGVEEALAALAGDRPPETTPVAVGTIEVAPVGAKAGVAGGEFRVTVTETGGLHGFRFLVAAKLADPCRDARARAAQARRELDIARRDGASQNVIRALEQQVNERRREATNCVRAAGVPGVDFRSPVHTFRSMDLFRTGGGDVVVDDLQVMFRILTRNDVAALNDLLGTNIETFVPMAEITHTIQHNVPANITISSVGARSGHIAITFTASVAHLNIGGSMEVEVEPSLSHDYRKLVSMRVVEFDLDGIGEIAEHLVKEAREGAEKAVANSQVQFNSQIVASLQPLFALGGTATLLGTEIGHDGVRVAIAVGFVFGSETDPCQAIRDAIRRLTQDLFIARRDGAADHVIAQLEAQLAARRRELEACAGHDGDDEAPEALTFSATSLDFGLVPIVGGTATRTLTIGNDTGSDVDVSFPAGFGVFRWPAFSGVLRDGEGRSFTLTFQPTSSQIVHGTMTVTSDTAASPDTITMSGKGPGGF
jgi:hypothetical protein